MHAPEGYEPVSASGVQAFARADERHWIERLLAEHGSLYEAAARLEDVRVLEGRAPVYAVPSPFGRRVIRRYHRGGAMAPLLGDRHLRLGRPRPLRETLASAEVRRRGIPTPQVTAGAVYPAGPFYRADVVTVYLPDAVELADVLFGEGGSMETERALERAGLLLARMAARGVRHPDLNARNILFVGREAFLLDLDRCRPIPDGRPVPARPMLARLERSLTKLATARGLGPPSATELEVLRSTALGLTGSSEGEAP